MPLVRPSYPRFLPSWLVPAVWKGWRARVALQELVRATRNWPKVAAAAQQCGLTNEEACDALLTAIGFNPAGISNSMLNALFLLPCMPDCGRSLATDEAALNSFVWELLRFNGPTVSLKTISPSLAIRTTAGEQHAVKAGTILFTSL